MTHKLTASILTTILVAIATINSSDASNRGDRAVTNTSSTLITTANKVKFQCETIDNSLYTIAQIEDKNKEKVINWSSNRIYFADPLKTQELCQNTAQKLQENYNSGKLKDISIFAEQSPNNLVKVCLKQKENAKCEPENLLLSLNTKDTEKQVICYLTPKASNKYAICAIRGSFNLRNITWKWLPF